MTKHGFRKDGKWSPEYYAWQNMKARVLRPRKNDGVHYSGVTICDRWINSFENFLADIGQRPGDGYSLERIDNLRGYEPGNCKWATATEQARNSRQCKLTEEKVGKIRVLRALGFTQQAIADLFGMNQSTISDILRGELWKKVEG